VKILIDAQLPPSLKVLLCEAGHEAHHVTDIGLRDAADSVVWEYAVREEIIILTKDEDFAARRLRNRDRPIIIWLRVGNSSSAALADWLMPLLPSIQDLVNSGESVIEVRR
jgi:predicted nuclease of predicted toxin-antitoxin system